MPQTSAITNELMQKVLRDTKKDDSVRVLDLLMEPATSKGDNYTSEIFRATVNYLRESGGKEIVEKLSIIVKLINDSNEVQRDFLEQYGIVDLEIKMMTSTLVEMEKILGDTKLAAKCLHGQEDPPIILIEDLKALGYQMADRETGLDLQHALVAIRGLAKFHASSVALYEKDPSIKKLYNRGVFFQNDNTKSINMFLDGALTSLAESMATWPELGQSYADKIMKMADGVLYQALVKKTAIDEKEFNVLNHGDFWVNNMMFRYDKNGQVTDHIFMDFQLPVFKSPALDLNYFFQASLAEDVLINNRDQIINEYSNVLTRTMQRIGCKTSPPTITELKNLLRKYALYELYTACICLPIMTADKKDVKSIEEMMSADGKFENSGTYNAGFRNRLTRRLKIWNEIGLLDI